MKLISMSALLRLRMVCKLQNDFAREMGPIDLDAPRYRHPLDILNWLVEDTEEDATPSDNLVGGECKPFANRIAFTTAVARLSAKIRCLTGMILGGGIITGTTAQD